MRSTSAAGVLDFREQMLQAPLNPYVVCKRSLPPKNEAAVSQTIVLSAKAIAKDGTNQN